MVPRSIGGFCSSIRVPLSRFVISLALLTPAVAIAQTATIDFEGLAEGAIVDQVSSGAGISGDPVSGFVGVFGASSESNPPPPNDNVATIFDATCTPTHSGNDADLCNPASGNILMIDFRGDPDGDGIVADPNDDENGGQLSFDFTTLGGGSVDIGVVRLRVFDIEEPNTGTIEIDTAGGNTVVVPIPSTPNGGTALVELNVDDVVAMRVNFTGSGAVDDIVLDLDDDVPPAEEEGCLSRTPGFWKNHPDVTSTFLPVTSCGLDLDAFAEVAEDMCISGTEAKAAGTTMQQLQLIRQCAAANLNVAASVAGGGDCDTDFPGIADTIAECCNDSDSICQSALSGSAIAGSGCIDALDEFNNSDDSLDPFGPFESPGKASPTQCKVAGKNKSVNPGRTLGPR